MTRGFTGSRSNTISNFKKRKAKEKEIPWEIVISKTVAGMFHPVGDSTNFAPLIGELSRPIKWARSRTSIWNNDKTPVVANSAGHMLTQPTSRSLMSAVTGAERISASASFPQRLGNAISRLDSYNCVRTDIVLFTKEQDKERFYLINCFGLSPSARFVCINLST